MVALIGGAILGFVIWLVVCVLPLVAVVVSVRRRRAGRVRPAKRVAQRPPAQIAADVAHSPQAKPAAPDPNTPTDALAEQFRSDKRQRVKSAMEDWDREWARLLGSTTNAPTPAAAAAEKSRPPVATSPIGNDGLRPEFRQRLHAVSAFKIEHGHLPKTGGVLFPEERSLGAWLYRQRRRHEAGRLTPNETTAIRDALGEHWILTPSQARHAERPQAQTTAPDRTHKTEPAEGVGVAQTLEHPGPAPVRKPQRKRIRSTRNDAVINGKSIEADPESIEADPGSLLASDPRTMWAWADAGQLPIPLSSKAARQVLEAIPRGDHVEIFGAVAVSKGYPHQSRLALPREARFAARTFHRWIIPSSGPRARTIPATKTKHYSTDKNVYQGGPLYMPESHFTLVDGRHLDAYADERTIDRFDQGAGLYILRLPDSPLAPSPPQLGTARLSPSSWATSPRPPLSERGDDALVAHYIDSVTKRVRKADVNYGSPKAWQVLSEAHGEDRTNRARNYLKSAVDAVRRPPLTKIHKATVSHFRNADLKAAFFCQVLDLPYPGDAPLDPPDPRLLTPADFY